MTVQRLELASVPAQPWKNGTGLTRELACVPEGAGFDHFEWRISVAEVAADATFSRFPGIERCIVLLGGAGMQLRAVDDGGHEHRLDQIGVPWSFDGDVPISARLIDGPCSDFNVMTRRGRWRAEVTRAEGAASLEGADAAMAFAIAGRWMVGGMPVGPAQALVWREPTDRVVATPEAGGQEQLLWVRLWKPLQP